MLTYLFKVLLVYRYGYHPIVYGNSVLFHVNRTKQKVPLYVITLYTARSLLVIHSTLVHAFVYFIVTMLSNVIQKLLILLVSLLSPNAVNTFYFMHSFLQSIHHTCKCTRPVFNLIPELLGTFYSAITCMLRKQKLL